MERLSHSFRLFMETLSFSAFIATMTSLLPPLVGLVSLIWYGMNIYEKWTGKKIADRRKKTRP